MKAFYYDSFRFIIATFLLVSLIGCERNYIDYTQKSSLSVKGRDIIFFGNSITEGAGASHGNDFPSLIAKEIQLPIINAGVSGDTTFDAINRLEEDVLSKNPLIVVVEFGGNDYLRGIPKKDTIENLDYIVKKIKRHNAMVVLVGVHCGILGNEYAKDLIKIAKKRKVAVIPDVQKDIFTPEFRSDHIHPNDKGYKIIAERILEVLKILIKANVK